MKSLRGAMDMYRALLGASRAKVFDICDNTIRVLEGNAAEADNEVGTFLADAGDRIGTGLSQLDFTSYVGEVAVEGPKAAVTGLAKDVVGKVLSGVAEAVVAEINEPASSDPMPPLESMVDSVRKLRAATQGDSDRIAGLVDDLSEYVAPGGAHYPYLIHEVDESAPSYPYGTGTGISDGASYSGRGSLEEQPGDDGRRDRSERLSGTPPHQRGRRAHVPSPPAVLVPGARRTNW